MVTLKQFVRKLPTNCLSVFDHFVGLALKGLTYYMPTIPYISWKNLHAWGYGKGQGISSPAPILLKNCYAKYLHTSLKEIKKFCHGFLRCTKKIIKPWKWALYIIYLLGRSKVAWKMLRTKTQLSCFVSCNFTKSTTTQCVFSRFFKLHKWF